MLYFDHNATTPLLSDARQAWLDAAEQFLGNPSSPHRLGTRAETALEAARDKVAQLLGCEPASIIWTSGATESNNAVLHHFARTLPPDAEIWVSAIEHPSVLEPAKFYFQQRCRPIPATHQGLIDLTWIEGRMALAKPARIVLTAANNETGVLQPWRKLLNICRQNEVPFFCDAVQWIGKMPANGLGECDYVSASAHKFGGPKGVGFLKVPASGDFKGLLLGGKQEQGRRAGTENVAGVLAMVAALENREVLLNGKEHEKRLAWREEFERALLQALPGVEIVGAGAKRLWNTVSAVMPEVGCQPRWVVRLDKFGYAVSTGSACASGREEPSHVLAAMGYPSATAGRVLRFSSGWETAPEHWHQLLEGIARTAASFKGQDNKQTLASETGRIHA